MGESEPDLSKLTVGRCPGCGFVGEPGEECPDDHGDGKTYCNVAITYVAFDPQERQDARDALRESVRNGPTIRDSWQNRYDLLADKLA